VTMEIATAHFVAILKSCVEVLATVGYNGLILHCPPNFNRCSLSFCSAPFVS
jgi:hypothetical protein